MNSQLVLEIINSGKDEEAVLEMDKLLDSWQIFDTSVLRDFMFAAVSAECAQVVRSLHRRWPSIIDVLNGHDETPLIRAANKGKYSMIRLLGELGTCAQHWFGVNNMTATVRAVFKGRAAAVEALYEIGCKDVMRNYALMHSAMSYSHVEVIKVLHRLNPTLITHSSPTSMPPLHFCAFMGSDVLCVMETLCQLDRAAIDQPHKEDITPMHRCMCVSAPMHFQRFLVLHRYGSEAHFSATTTGRIPGNYIDYDEETSTGPGIGAHIRRVYFSRSLAEVLFFVMDEGEIHSSQRI